MIGDLGFHLTDGVCGEIAAATPPCASADEWRVRALVRVAECILGQIARPYPCSERQTLMGPEDLELPRERFRVFFGSFDWHSCVHSHWTLVRLIASGVLDPVANAACDLGDVDLEDLQARVLSQLETSFVPAGLAEEAEAWRTRIPAYEERPYGVTWFLALDAELGRLAAAPGELSGRAKAWRETCAPMTAEMRRRVLEWARGLALPTRSGIHTDTAWSLAMAWDWAAFAGDAELSDVVRKVALRLYSADVNAPRAYEPGGDTFTSSILNEAACMARVMEPAAYDAWLQGFLPALYAPAGEGSEAPLLPDLARAWDGASYLGVHEVALPLARCLAARDAAGPLPASSPARARLAADSRRWMRQGAQDTPLDGYLADHWVGSFVAAALLGAPDPKPAM